MQLDPRGGAPIKAHPLDSRYLIPELAGVLPRCSPEEDALLEVAVLRDGQVYPWLADEFGGLIDGSARPWRSG